MKHAGARALDTLEDLLERVRAVTGLQERARGVFYRRSSAFLHFHEDEAGLFADLRAATDWERFPVDTATQRTRLFRRVLAMAQDSDQRRANTRNSRRSRAR